MLFSVLCGQVWFQNRRMKHKRQTLSKDETDIKTPKSKSESGGLGVGEGGKVRTFFSSLFADFKKFFFQGCGGCASDGGLGCQGCELPPGAACPGSVKDEDEEVKVRSPKEIWNLINLNLKLQLCA